MQWNEHNTIPHCTGKCFKFQKALFLSSFCDLPSVCIKPECESLATLLSDDMRVPAPKRHLTSRDDASKYKRIGFAKTADNKIAKTDSKDFSDLSIHFLFCKNTKRIKRMFLYY